ncbi:sensor histidine kinase [Luteibacter aegosomatissinici]|uniref:sensor histidine kinase n=1 Tax=Luteibacter aegosomatissinici TaxID=2911539 RepID=UPI001FF92698|nr:sensor histidine kinase [Luteibacter aegosomatissinici]UPG95763.1 sensor histidine kinase [Luteibacter aegosomatissinici]
MSTSWFRPAPDSLWRRLEGRGKARIASLFNLVWVVWAFADVGFNGNTSGDWWWVTLVSFTAFLALYTLAYIRPCRHTPWYGLAMALLGYATLGVNSAGGTSYVIFAGSFMAFSGSPRACVARVVAVLVGYIVAANVLRDWGWQPTLILGMVYLFVAIANLLWRINGQKEWELKLSHDEVRRLAATAERERIGRDLHDLLGHTLSLITLKLELSRRLLDRDTEAARREMEEAERVARHALAEVRSAVTGIRATGLAAELASARLLLGSSSIAFDYITEVPVLPARMENQLALVLREAVTNIHRHAEATAADAKVQVVGNELTLCIADNGRGTAGAEGNGLCGMRERVRGLGGTMNFESVKGKGTKVLIRVPLTADDRRELPEEPRRLAS